MSADKEMVVYCDDCYENCNADDRHLSATQIRRNRKARDGWIQIGSRDYCEQCAAKRTKGKRGEDL